MTDQVKPLALVIGGSSGLGYELAKRLALTHEVIITGRDEPKNKIGEFIRFYLNDFDELGVHGELLLKKIPRPINTFVYAAGYAQIGELQDLTAREITNMIIVGLSAPALLLNKLIAKQGYLQNLLVITSTSQTTPRQKEPIYCATKSGLAMLANSLSLTERFGKVLVAAPSGMRTKFWQDHVKDLSQMLDPEWVAEQIMSRFSTNFKYEFMKILRDPPRVEITETRYS